MNPRDDKRVIYACHERTKHHFHRYASGPPGLDWANQPDPFRRWEGAPSLPLELVPPTPEPLYGPSLVEGGVRPSALDPRSVAQLLFDSFSISAWKQMGESRWSLRVNPSSGNLHPTEVYLLMPAVPGLCERPGVFHYSPREHGLEQRAAIPDPLWEDLARDLAPGSFYAGLTSIHWREAWKYGERAFRYCQHDAGHAIAALSIAAAGLGWRVELVEEPGTSEVAELLGVFGDTGPEAELPDCLLLVRTRPGEGPTPRIASGTTSAFRDLAWQGSPNALSPDHRDWELIEVATQAALKPRTEHPYTPWSRPGRATVNDSSSTPLRPILRQRRSCLALDGKTGLSAAEFFRVLESTMPRTGRIPFNAIPWSPRIHLALFVHRIDGLQPGLYFLARDPAKQERIRRECRPEFLWGRPEGCPEDLPLALLLPMDLRQVAEQLSCHQEIAGQGAFSLGMIAEFEASIEEHGAWFYPRLFWESGAVGQVLYLEAEALGRRSTGIGCFFDDGVHSLLGLGTGAFQSLYHFTLGGALEDPRLTTLPAYPGEGEGGV